MIFIRTLLLFLKDREYRGLLMASAFIVTVGTVVYHYVEGWNWLDSLYFSVIALTTIGFGDFAPQTDLGKAFTIVYIIVGVGLILAFINTVYLHFSRFRSNNDEK
ncbi:potassium channel family protein [Roseivirga misakiensis]|uniref:Potassium channel domain-containing protein n=1 Tax=Roseivirga misakiensis TaxID=1563681 RepID=A0A1E5T2Z1_9BACT|nr:potassium channel family protein [Roseivirga misakiensis]OEK05742.1 hypothetical protein BFP71_06365 [Roseivirga misakiensis]